MSDPPAADDTIVPDNIRAVGIVYDAYLLERMRAFQVIARLVELYQQGLLPLGAGTAANGLQRYALAGDRLTKQQREDLYAHTLGVPGTASEAQPNREFCDLWLRFVSSVALDTCRAPLARALAINASVHGSRLTPVASRLRADVQALVELLSEPSISQVFGARDMWQVIDQVNSNELGGAVDVARYRTQAHAGRAILNWLAEKAGDGTPVDAGLLRAVDEWLVASGVIDLRAMVQVLLQAIGARDGEGSGTAATSARAGAVLLCGERGCGKTLAAYALAEALGVGLLRLDLSRIVSQYIGDTEKNLDAIFDEAQASGAVLLIDEADALFAKRGEYKDAHDRYASLETAYLLQRIEACEGLVILTSTAPPQLEDDSSAERWRRVLRRRVCFPLPKPG